MSSFETAPEIDDHENAGIRDLSRYVYETDKTAREAARDTEELLESSDIANEKKLLFQNRLERSWRQLVKILSFAGALLAPPGALETIEYVRTHYAVTTSMENSGHAVYTHEDPETTHIINILAGKESLSEDEQKDILIDKIFRQDTTIKIENLNGKPIEVLLSMTPSTSKTIGVKDIINPNPPTFNQELYDALWKLEQEAGSPKIKIRLDSKHGPGRSFYVGHENTAYIDVDTNGEMIDNLLAELSHAKQRDEHPTSYKFRALRDHSRAEKIASEEDLDKDSAYDKYTYDTPGSLENEAHRFIEPELKTRLGKLTPTRSKENRELYDKKVKEIERRIKHALEEELRYHEKALRNPILKADIEKTKHTKYLGKVERWRAQKIANLRREMGIT